MKQYKQCGLAQGDRRTVGWIETRGATLGASVEIKELGGFWKVTGVGDTVMTGKELSDRDNARRHGLPSIA